MNTVKLIYHIFIIAFLISLSSCKKEKEEENPTTEDTPITIISPDDNTMVYDSIKIVYSIDPGLNIIRTECYVDFELIESFDDVPQDLYFYSDNQEPGDTIQYFLKIYIKEGQEFISNIVVLVISQLSPPILDINIITNETVELFWTDESNSEDGFVIYRSMNNNSFEVIKNLEPNQIYFVDNGLDTLNNYKYKVEVFSEHENRASNIVKIAFIHEFRSFQQFKVPESPSSNIAISEDLKKLVITNYHEDNFTLLDVETGTITPLFHPNGTKGLAISKNEGFFATGGSHSYLVKIWDLETGGLIKELVSGAKPFELCLNSMSEHLVTSGSPTKIFNISDANELMKFESETIVRALHYLNNESKLITAGNDDLIRIWDVNSGELIRTLEGHTGHIGSIALSNDESKIISGSYEDNTIRIWDTNSGALINTFDRNSGITSLVVDKDNNIIVATYDGSITLMSIEGQISQTIEGHDYLLAMDYNKTHNLIATYGKDSTNNAKLFKIIGQWETIFP